MNAEGESEPLETIGTITAKNPFSAPGLFLFTYSSLANIIIHLLRYFSNQSFVEQFASFKSINLNFLTVTNSY